MRISTLLLLLLLALASACAAPTGEAPAEAAGPAPAEAAAGTPAESPAASPAASPDETSGSGSHGDAAAAAPTIGTPGKVDYSCSVDADCTVKNIGNCCGYYPACVNVDSPVFPEQVQAECEREGRMSICGYPEIRGCRCVEGRCEAATGTAAALE